MESYERCGLGPNGHKAYYEGFNAECMSMKKMCEIPAGIVKLWSSNTQTQTLPSNNCRASGMVDGKSGIFDTIMWTSCGGASQSMYYEGFISGCTLGESDLLGYCKNFALGSMK
jgi:hypothetical protein